MTEDYKLSDEKKKMTSHSRMAKTNNFVISDENKYIIGTRILDTCFGILLYDRKNKFGVCAHVDPMNVFEIMAQMLIKFKSNDESVIEFVIIPGYKMLENHDFNKTREILSTFRVYSEINPNIKFTPLESSLNQMFRNDLSCYEFAFDTKTGEDVSSIIFKNLNKERSSKKSK